MNYILPQTQVFQDVRQAPTATVANLNPFAYGAHYSLRRYSEASEKALIGIGAYSPAAGVTAAYPNLVAGSVVDQNYVHVYADDAWLKYAEIAKNELNPVMLTDSSVRNKLRAAPRVVDGGTSAAVPMVVKGCHTGTIALPEAYYFYPEAKFTIGSAAGVFTYETTEGIAGSMVVPLNAPVAGTKVAGPDGLVMDFGTGAEVKSPRVVTFKKSGSAFAFTLGVKASRLQTLIDRDLNSTAHAGQVKVAITKDHDAVAVIYDGTDLVIEYQTTTTLAELHAAILGSADYADISADFDISALPGTTNDTVILAVDQDADSMATGSAIAIIPDCYRVYVYENTWVFKTGNGSNKSSSLYKDVEVGDKIKWSVTPVSTGTPITGWSTVAGLLPDYTRATLAAAVESDNNQDTQSGDNISAGIAFTAGTDNQNTAFNMTTSTVKSVTGTHISANLVNGVVTENLIITVTKAGTVSDGDKPEVTVENASGTYRRTNVLIEAGVEKGRIYLGNNMYATFISAGDAKFYLGDTYTVEVEAPYTAVTNEVASGTYVGTRDTTYQIEVIRGGVFARTATAVKAVTTTIDATLVPVITGWTGGDVNDEYILECTAPGSLAAATFRLTSQRGDNVEGLGFIGWDLANAVDAGASGLKLYFTDGGTTPSFTAGQYFIITVKAARPKIRITDSAGIDQETSVVVASGSNISLGLNGAQLQFPANANGGLILGDIFTVEASAEAPAAIQTIVLADELPASILGGASAGVSNFEPDMFAVDIAVVKASKEVSKYNEDPGVTPGAYNWSTTSSAVTLAQTIKLQDSSLINSMAEMPFVELVHGNIYVQYRSLLQDYTDAIYSITDTNSVATELGPACEDNPLSLSVLCILENIGRGTCYFTAIPTDDATGDSSALAKASLTNMVWALTPAGVTDPARHAVLAAHIATMSTELGKRWRGGFVGRELPTEAAVLVASNNIDLVDWRATVTTDTRAGHSGITKVTMSQDAGLLSRLAVGDTVKVKFTTDAWGRTSYVSDTVAEVTSNTVCYLRNGLSSELGTNSKIEAYHPYSTQEIADAVKAISEGYANKRMYHVFPGNAGKYGTYVSAAYPAASVAGLVGSVVPQQGLTNIAITGYDDLPLVYGLFSYEQLNTIASGGTLILMQDTRGGQVYVRHQISTAYKDGNLNTTELSMVKNLDSISYYFNTVLSPFIGKFNVTPEIISVISTQVQDGLNFLGSLTGVGLIGPQLILNNGNTKIRTIAQHPTLKDRIVAIVDLELPAPLNVIEFHLVV